MRLYTTDPLFAWARLEDHPQLSTLRQLLATLPDQVEQPGDDGFASPGQRSGLERRDGLGKTVS